MLQQTQRVVKIPPGDSLQPPKSGFPVIQLVEAGHGHGLGGRAVRDNRGHGYIAKPDNHPSSPKNIS
ncbi:hypothetical protein D3C76_1862400 [compost metagenome]